MKFFKKGKMYHVRGTMVEDSYDDKNGNKVRTYRFRVEDFDLLDNRNENHRRKWMKDQAFKILRYGVRFVYFSSQTGASSVAHSSGVGSFSRIFVRGGMEAVSRKNLRRAKKRQTSVSFSTISGLTLIIM